MLETLREDYIMAARAKGLPEQMVRDKHAARNALLPVFYQPDHQPAVYYGRGHHHRNGLLLAGHGPDPASGGYTSGDIPMIMGTCCLLASFRSPPTWSPMSPTSSSILAFATPRRPHDRHHQHPRCIPRASLRGSACAAAGKIFKDNWALFAENKIGLIGLGIILFYALLAHAAPHPDEYRLGPKSLRSFHGQ